MKQVLKPRNQLDKCFRYTCVICVMRNGLITIKVYDSIKTTNKSQNLLDHLKHCKTCKSTLYFVETFEGMS